MTWYHNDEVVETIDFKEFPCFVYLITNLITGKKYIGLKTTSKLKYRQVSGKRKKSRVESEWRGYWSSSVALQEDVKKLGPENFKREILHYCRNKGTANYLEAKEQFDRRVLELPDEYYNGIINCRVNRKHIKLEK